MLFLLFLFVKCIVLLVCLSELILLFEMKKKNEFYEPVTYFMMIYYYDHLVKLTVYLIVHKFIYWQ